MIKTTTVCNTKCTYIGVAALLFAVVAYLYFLNMSVVHVVMRKEADQEYNQLRAEIATLEAEYIAAQYKINEKITLQDDFDRDTDKIFVRRDSADVLVLRTN